MIFNILVNWGVAIDGDPETAPDLCERLVSFINDDYAGWDKIREHYRQNEVQILASLREEFDLIYDK